MPEAQKPIAYYDGDCGFCKKMVRLIRSLLLLSAAMFRPAQSDPSVYADMQAQNSWVLVDPAGRRHFKFQAFIELCRISPICKIFVPFLRWGPVSRLGNRCYERFAKNRSFFPAKSQQKT